MQIFLNVLFFFGRPIGPIYSALMKLREKVYSSELLHQNRLPVPVISVGNLVLGGTGKTPTVRYLANLLLKHGYRPAIVSRGHGGKANKKVNIVSNGSATLLTPSLAGDEPFLLAESLPGVPVLTGKRRIFPCLLATENFNVDVIILDDGFQHLSVARDLDLVLFDSTTLAGNSRVFPGGVLREPISALNRCHAFLMTGKSNENQLQTQKFSDLLQEKYPGKPVFVSTLRPTQLIKLDESEEPYRLNNQEKLMIEDCDTNNYFGFCGIANPERFEHTLEKLGIDLTSFFALKDHRPYSQSLIRNICKRATQSGADRLITTEKDFVKLKSFKFTLPLYVLKIEQKFEDNFDLFILNALSNLKNPESAPAH